MQKEITECRICGNKNLKPIINLGKLALGGVFPKSKTEVVPSGDLALVKCHGNNYCGLMQLKHTFNLHQMYGINYGYRSGLNQSMVQHLKNKVRQIESIVPLVQGDIVLDIGSNDGTLLRAYSKQCLKIGIDSCGEKFKGYYKEDKHIIFIPGFFGAKLFQDRFGDGKAKVITSIAVFYDLEAPLKFMEDIKRILADDGIWILEQSYMPSMIKNVDYTTICHEHLEYYSLKQIKWMADKVGLEIIGVEFNKINGGSFSVMLSNPRARYKINEGLIDYILMMENYYGEDAPYTNFYNQIIKHKDNIHNLFNKIKNKKGLVLGYGASTKGNTLLQFCELTQEHIMAIAEINEEKFGCFTPGSLIPIISEQESKAIDFDYYFVLPWHLKDSIMQRKDLFSGTGKQVIFPLPKFISISPNNDLLALIME